MEKENYTGQLDVHCLIVIFSINSDLVLDLPYLREEAESYFAIVCILSYI